MQHPPLPEPIASLPDAELAKYVARGWRCRDAAAREVEANLHLHAAAVESGRRQLVAALPAEARFLSFQLEADDDGKYLLAGTVFAADGAEVGEFFDLTDAPARATAGQFTSTLTELWGTSAAGIDLASGDRLTSCPPGPEPDPFEGLVLNDAFVEDAAIREAGPGR